MADVAVVYRKGKVQASEYAGVIAAVRRTEARETAPMLPVTNLTVGT